MIYEIVVYSATEEGAADAARAAVRTKIESLPGFIGFMPMKGAEDGTRRADIAIWSSLDAAKAAAGEVGSDPGFAPFLSSIAKVDSMGHFVPQWPVPQALSTGQGIEIGRFRLKPGFSEADARAAHRHAIDTFMSRQAGWLAEYMVRFADGTYADVLIAESQARAEAICAMWHGQPACEAFVAMVDVSDLAFGAMMA